MTIETINEDLQNLNKIEGFIDLNENKAFIETKKSNGNQMIIYITSFDLEMIKDKNKFYAALYAYTLIKKLNTIHSNADTTKILENFKKKFEEFEIDIIYIDELIPKKEYLHKDLQDIIIKKKRESETKRQEDKVHEDMTKLLTNLQSINSDFDKESIQLSFKVEKFKTIHSINTKTFNDQLENNLYKNNPLKKQIEFELHLLELKTFYYDDDAIYGEYKLFNKFNSDDLDKIDEKYKNFMNNINTNIGLIRSCITYIKQKYTIITKNRSDIIVTTNRFLQDIYNIKNIDQSIIKLKLKFINLLDKIIYTKFNELLDKIVIGTKVDSSSNKLINDVLSHINSNIVEFTKLISELQKK